MQPSEMTNVQIADYILSLQSDVDGSPFSSNEIIREAARRLLMDGDDDISKDAEIAELRERIKIAEVALTELQTRLVSSVYDGTMNPYEALEITERAIAAISEKGGAK